jgi:hypothetical protein
MECAPSLLSFFYRYAVLAMLGYTTPSASYMSSTYTFAMNVPDAYLSPILEKVMSFTVKAIQYFFAS